MNKKFLLLLAGFCAVLSAFHFNPKKNDSLTGKINDGIWDQGLKLKEQREQFKKLTEQALSKEKIAMQQLQEQIQENRQLCEINGSLVQRCHEYSEVVNKLERLNETNAKKIKELEKLMNQQKGNTALKTGEDRDEKTRDTSVPTSFDVANTSNGERKKEQQ